MSRAIFDAPTIWPSAFRSGEIVKETSNKMSVLVTAHRLEMIDPLTTSQSGKYLRLLVLALVGYDGGDRASDHLIG